MTETTGVMEVGGEEETTGQDGTAPDHAAGAENDVTGIAHEIGPVPVPDPGHQLRNRDARGRQSGTNRREFHSR